MKNSKKLQKIEKYDAFFGRKCYNKNVVEKTISALSVWQDCLLEEPYIFWRVI